MVEPERPQVTIWRRIACWVSKATRAKTHVRGSALTSTPNSHALAFAHLRAYTHTHTDICNTPFLQLHFVSRTRHGVTFYRNCLACHNLDGSRLLRGTQFIFNPV